MTNAAMPLWFWVGDFMGQNKKKDDEDIIINNSDENQLDADSASKLFDNLFSEENNESNSLSDETQPTKLRDASNVEETGHTVIGEIDLSADESMVESSITLEEPVSEGEIDEIDFSNDATEVASIELEDHSGESSEPKEITLTMETKISQGVESEVEEENQSDEIEFGVETELSISQDNSFEEDTLKTQISEDKGALELEENSEIGELELSGNSEATSLELESDLTASISENNSEVQEISDAQDIGDATELLPSISEIKEDETGLTSVTESIAVDSEESEEDVPPATIKFDSKSELNETPTLTDFATNEGAGTKVDLSSIDIEVPAIEDISKISPQNENSITKKIVRNESDEQIHSGDHLHEFMKENKDLLQFNEEEQIRMKSNLKLLREEREKLSESIHDLELENQKLKSDQSRILGQLDELKIENKILRTRYQKELENLNLSIKLSEDKRRMQVEKNKNYEKEIEELTFKVRQDVNSVRNKERELENQLELLKSDAKVQIENRDSTIIELKRKVEALEFNIESISMSEVRSKQEVEKMSDKLSKVINTLRASIEMLEGETDSFSSREFLKKIKL